MTSKQVYGPYSNLRETGPAIGHSAFFEFHGQWYHTWEFTDDSANNRSYRQVMITYLHYRDNGDMVDDDFFVQHGGGFSTGVGNYDARWDTISAAWFFRIDQADKKECPAGGFEIQNIRDGSVLEFPKVRNLAKGANITFTFSAKTAGGRIEVRSDHPEGALLGACTVEPTHDWSVYHDVSCPLRNPGGEQNLVFVFRGAGSDLLHLRSFSFRGNRNASLGQSD